MNSEIETLLDALEGMVRQHCYADKDGLTDSGFISANAEAMELLAHYCRFKIKKSAGRCVLGHWIERDAEVKA